MLSRIGDDRPIALEAVGNLVLAFVNSIDFVMTILEEVSQPTLQEL
jgi:hypothetical protein